MKTITLTKVISNNLFVLFLVVMTSLSVQGQTTLFSADFSNATGDNAWAPSTSSGSIWNRDITLNYPRTAPWFTYSNNSFSDYVSPVMDFSGYNTLNLSVDIAYDTEASWDGMRIEYRISGGAWTALGTQASGFYNDTDVDGIGNNEDGWSGEYGFTFFNVTLDLSAFDATFDGASNVQFRFVFGSDGTQVRNGASFDNFVIQGTAVVAGPEINIESGGFSILDGDVVPDPADNTDFGSVNTLNDITDVFTIRNYGTTDLTVTSVALSGADAGQFSIPATSGVIAAGGSLDFNITYDPSTVAVHNATVTILNDDADEGTYTFAITGTGVAPSYCLASGNINAFTDVIRRVNINTIDNLTITENNRYSDFTSISTDLQQGSSHNLTVQVNTDGAATYYIKAWIDWNQDFDFNDPGEEYDLGTANNVIDGATSLSPLSITVPGGATLGTTRMRVMHRYNAAPTDPCEDGTAGGEVEDYSINVTSLVPAPEITVTGNGNNITDGDTVAITSNHTDFGGTSIGNTITRTFTIANTGNLDLAVSTPTITGGGAARFNMTTTPATTVVGGTSTTLVIDYTPTALVTSTATVTFVNGDADESPFSFVIEGDGIDPSSSVDIYCEDFNSGTGSWSNTTSTAGAWGQGTEATASAGASGSYFYTQRTSGVYNNDSHQVVTSPVIDMTGYEKINFSIDVWYDMSNDGNTSVATPDGFQIQYTDDGGTTWFPLGNARGDGTNWYNSRVIYNFGATAGGSPTYIDGWTNTSSGWVTANIEMHSQAVDNNANVQFRIDFRSDASTTDVGVAFDNVCITGFPIETVTDPTCGPAGIGANLTLWLRADAGTSTTTNGGTISEWIDQAFSTDYTNATASSGQEPQYRNNATDNVNFHPVVKFDGTTSTMAGRKGFYSDEFYIVLKPTNPITSASGAVDVFCADDYRDNAPSEDVTGFEMGDTSARFTNDVIAYNQGPNTDYGIARVSTTETIDNPHIFNGRANSSNNGAELFQDGLNVGNTIVNAANFTRIANSRYWLGRSEVFGASFDGDIMEVISYSSRNSDADQQKIQSYLATKYGITLGTNGISLNYVDTDGNTTWDITEDGGAFNFDIAGIGRDDCSALNQKQSRSINSDGLLTFSLGDQVYPTNADNPNTFTNDKEFLLWGNDNGNLAGAAPIDVDMSAGIGGLTTNVDFLAIERIWKVVESGTIGSTKVSIPEVALTSVITPPGNFLMFISDTPSFNPTSEYRVMYPNGANLETDYDFNGTKYITFGYAPEYRFERSITFDGVQDYLEVEDALDLIGPFTISLWVNRGPNSNNKDLLGKRNGSPYTDGYSLRLDGTGKPRMLWKNAANATQAISAETDLPFNEWHHVAITYDGTNATFYIDGVEDGTAPLDPPIASPGQNFLIGAVDHMAVKNYFDGTLDEVRVWDGALTVDQLRFIMNQEIEENTNFVDGKIIPNTISKNEVGTLAWPSLKGYFPMNLFAYTNVKDESDSGLIAAIRNLDTVDAQTAPLPYESAADGDWVDAATWENGTGFQYPGATAIADASVTVDWNIVQTSHLVDTQANISVLALDVLSNELSIENDSKMSVSHYLKLDGLMDLVGESQLVQTAESDLDINSTGSLERDQQGTADTFTYNYWSAPVSTINGSAINEDYTVASVMRDGTNENAPVPFGISGGLDGAAGPPISLSAYWFYKYANQVSATYSAWQYVGPSGTMTPGEGWTMKGPGSGGVTDDQNYTFIGKPNNSTIAEPIALSVNNGNDYLVGNPFPSALDANDFIADNPHLDGTLLFWEHWGGGTHYLSQYQGGYAMYNLSGGTPAVSHPLVNQTGSGTKTPGRYVPVGQGFFVVATANGTIEFNNGQRNFVKEGASSVFAIADGLGGDITKAAQSNASETQLDDTIFDEEDTRTKLRFGFEAPDGLHRQLLLTVDKATTFEYDRGYDGFIKDVQGDDMTWVVEGKHAVIQGVPNLHVNNVFPLHLHLQNPGDIEISLEDVAFDNDELYILLWDQLLDTYTDLRHESFNINLATGAYNDRFAVVFKYENDEPNDDDEETDTDDSEDTSDEDDSDSDDSDNDDSDQTNDKPDDTGDQSDDSDTDTDDNGDSDSDDDDDDSDQDQNEKPKDDGPIQDKPREDGYPLETADRPLTKGALPLITTQYLKVNRTIAVNIETKTNISVASLYTMTGQIVKQWSLDIDSGLTKLPVSEISDGVYLLHLQTEHGLIAKKVLVF